MRTRLITAVSVLFYVDGFLLVISLLLVLVYVLANKSLPNLGGIRLLSGPFEALGIDAMIVTGIMYVLVNAMKILAAYWLGNARQDGAVLGLILAGLSAIFWYGFAMPVGPLFGIPEVILLVLAWRALT